MRVLSALSVGKFAASTVRRATPAVVTARAGVGMKLI